jgi:hypothetical protein
MLLLVEHENSIARILFHCLSVFATRDRDLFNLGTAHLKSNRILNLCSCAPLEKADSYSPPHFVSYNPREISRFSPFESFRVRASRFSRILKTRRRGLHLLCESSHFMPRYCCLFRLWCIKNFTRSHAAPR